MTDIVNQSVINDILEKRAQKRVQEEQIVENVEEYKAALEKIFTSEDGKIFYKYLARYCRLHTVEEGLNTVRMVEDNGKRSVFLKGIRPFLSKSTLIKLEEIV